MKITSNGVLGVYIHTQQKESNFIYLQYTYMYPDIHQGIIQDGIEVQIKDQSKHCYNNFHN